MEQNNPYAAPQVALIDQQVPQGLPGWSPGQLRVLGWLCLASVVVTLVAMVAVFFSGGEESSLAGRISDWMGTLASLLGCYLLLRFKAFLEQRFAAGGLTAPTYLIILTSLTSEALHWIWGDALFASFDWRSLLYFAVLVLMGAGTVWLGVVLLRVKEPYPVVRVVAWLELVGGIMAASVILLVLSFIPLLAGTVATALVFFRGAAELAGREAA